MRSYEIEALEAGKAHAAARDEAAASPDLAARAAVAGRTDALPPSAVLRLQRAAGNAGVAAVLEGEQEQESPVKDVVGRGGGQPLEAPVRQRMEASLGADFSDVRVHTGASAAASARAVDAHAYTVGNEIVLGDGHTPGSDTHDRTLAHELTHVVQQRQGPVDGTPTAGGISVSDPSDRFERAAEATADAVMSSVPATAPAASVQRESAPEEEEPVQALAIQRQAEEELPEEEEPVQALAIQREAALEEELPEEEEPVQALAIQREAALEEELPEEEEPVQALAIQREAAPAEEELPA